GYVLPDGAVALSADEKIARGKQAIAALSQFREAKKAGKSQEAIQARAIFDENVSYFGYGYIKNKTDLVPNVPLLFWSFRIMVGLGVFFIAFFAVMLFLASRKQLANKRWLHWVGILSIPMVYMASQSGWVVAEVGRQPWAIQDLLPVGVAISKLPTSSVQLTFFIFLLLFTVLLIAEIRILLKAIQKGPENLPGERKNPSSNN
ncbi:MAG: cytochrome ubiquinol oxidase subunit I, partial [Phocaeicola sp.]